MGKLNHIPELTGSDTYFAWRCEVRTALGIEDLWCHIMEVIVPGDILGIPSFIPDPADPLAPTANEMLTIHAWLIKDLKAKGIITRRLSPSVAQFVGEDHTVSACTAWKILADHYGRTDISSQYVICSTLFSLNEGLGGCCQLYQTSLGTWHSPVGYGCLLSRRRQHLSASLRAATFRLLAPVQSYA